MNIEVKITELLQQAEPLRLLHDDDAGKEPLGGIVDQINALRAEQARHGKQDPQEASEAAEIKRGIEDAYGRQPNPGEVEFFSSRPKRGRPARIEGDNA